MRQLLEEARRHQRIMPKPTEIATTNRFLLLDLKSTPVRMRAPVAATMPNITSPAPPSTTSGTASTKADIFGSRPRMSMMMPPVTVTQRERTPVTPTRPTFCENDV